MRRKQSSATGKAGSETSRAAGNGHPAGWGPDAAWPRAVTAAASRAAGVASGGTPFIVRRILSLAVGVLIGQWLAWSAGPSPAEFHARSLAAWERRDYAGALGSWSEGATLRPDDPLLQYRRATALARLGQWWARFLGDTGSSVTIVAPALAASLGLLRSAGPGVELQTVAGPTAGPAARLASLRVGEAELRDVPVVVHDPGPGDGRPVPPHARRAPSPAPSAPAVPPLIHCAGARPNGGRIPLTREPAGLGHEGAEIPNTRSAS